MIYLVLIVAECNVNYDINLKNLTFKDVLIVAECNVNVSFFVC